MAGGYGDSWASRVMGGQEDFSLSGLLGGIGEGINANPQMLMMAGLGLLSGKNPNDAWENAMLGMQRGTQLDAASRKTARDLEAQKARATAAAAWAKANGVDPALAASSPELAEAGMKAQMAAKFREPSPQERLLAQYERETDPKRKAVLGDLLGVGPSAAQKQIAERRIVAQQEGFTPEETKHYVATGNLPSAKSETMTDAVRKEVFETDGMVNEGQSAVSSLQKAKELSKKAHGGLGRLSTWSGKVGASFGSEAGIATAELDNLVTSSALESLKSTFGGQPTEGERKILLEIQGSSGQPDAVRQKIYDRAIAAAERRIALNREKGQQLRGGTYFKPGGGTADIPYPTQNAPDPLGLRGR